MTRADVARLPALTRVPAGPRRQPSSRQVLRLASISITRPVTSADSTEASHATIGELLAGSMASKASPSPPALAIIFGEASTVIRVRATGAMALTVAP